MNFFTWLLYRKLFIQLHFDDSSGGSSSGTSSEPTVEQLQQQVKETEAKLKEIQDRIDKGTLVDPQMWIKTQIEAGTYFPKDRYVGLQQTFQAEQEAHKQSVVTVGTLTTAQKKLETQLAALEKERETLQSQLQEKDVQVNSLNSAINRKSLIMQEFPHLAAFEAKGLLPAGEGDALKGLLSQFTEQIDNVGKQAAETFASGGGQRTPVSLPEQKTETPTAPEDIQKLAFKKLREGDKAEYDKLMDQYYEALAKDAIK